MPPQRIRRKLIRPVTVLIIGVGLCASSLPSQTEPARQPYSKEAIISLLKGEVSPKRVAELARQRGIGFQITPEVERELRQAKADDTLIATLRDLAPKPPEKPAEIVVDTSPGAEVYVDDQFLGRTSPEGRLVVAHPTAGQHTLRVSLAGKRDYEQTVAVAAGQVTRIAAVLADLAGTVLVQSSPGAAVFLDDSSHGTTGPSGQLSIPEVAAGAHQLRVSAAGKNDYRNTIQVTAGEQVSVNAALADMEKPPPPVRPVKENPPEVPLPPAGTVRENRKDGLKYVWIPPGTFMMGCSPGDSECAPEERPAHQVTLSKGFWMGQTEVTLGAYLRFAGATGARKPPEATPTVLPNSAGLKARPSDEVMPVVDVPWGDAQAYCRWAGGKLPTEAEWEYAARAGSTAAAYGDLDQIAWFADNSGKQRLNSTLIWNQDRAHYVNHLQANGNGMYAVGQKQPNSFGLYDMLGNVWQWVNDWYDPGYYRSSPPQDPTGPAGGALRVLRGGSWFNYRGMIRVSYRSRNYPAGNNNLNAVGFRCGGEGIIP